MRGPSSSHTAASVRIGLLGRTLMKGKVKKAVFTFDPDGSLATTYRGQGSAMGLAAGLLGMEISDPKLVNAEAICNEMGIELSFQIKQIGANHPNTYDIELIDEKGIGLRFTALSTGGGKIRLIELAGKEIVDDRQFVDPLMPLAIADDPLLPFTTIDDLEKSIQNKKRKLSEYAIDYESSLGDVSTDYIAELASNHLDAMLNSVETGLEGTEYSDRILHRQSHLLDDEKVKNNIIPSKLLNRMIKNVTAVMETKSSMGVIVAAPTAGSCGALAGSLAAMCDTVAASGEDLESALMAAGLVGVFVSQQGGFAAEEGGCQYECGAASGMTAAALVNIMGGDAAVALRAASMAMQNTLGLICDPVADRVEVPCLGKNIMAALNAAAAANMAIAGFAHVIPLKQVIEAMREVGEGMDQRYCCTCKGGLSITAASQLIQKNLDPNKS